MQKTQNIKGKYNIDKLIPDTSVIIEGLVSKYIVNGQIKVKEILIHEAVLGELENQANSKKLIGDLGLEEVKKIRKLSKKYGFKVVFSGRRASAEEIKQARRGEIDALIRSLAAKEKGVLFTADKVQGKVADAKGIKNIFVKIEQVTEELSLEKFFSNGVMSVHIRENQFTYVKNGKPGKTKLCKLGKKLKKEEVEKIAKESFEEAIVREGGFIETDKRGITILNTGELRVVITKPPLSEYLEITATKSIKEMNLKDYKIDKKLMAEIVGGDVLIIGKPGSGKSTFVNAFAKYLSKNKIIKVVESPRDLIKGNFSKYSTNGSSNLELLDALLLSRPDYVIFDSLKSNNDFKLFNDLKISGLNVLGIMNGINVLEILKRCQFIVKTIILIDGGKVKSVFRITDNEIKSHNGEIVGQI